VTPTCRIVEAGTVPYGDAFALQKSDVAKIQAGGEERFYLLEHPHVITIGRNASGNALTADPRDVEARGGVVVHTDRGGDVTYHGPGQIVGYPLLRLDPPQRDVRRYVHNIEQMLIDAIGTFGIEGRHHPRHRGVWVDDRKIASVGIRIAHWVTCHGFALNVNTDLTWFDLMNPCGIAGCTMTSMAEETGSAMDTTLVIDAIVQNFERVFARRTVRGDAMRDQPAYEHDRNSPSIGKQSHVDSPL